MKLLLCALAALLMLPLAGRPAAAQPFPEVTWASHTAYLTPPGQVVTGLLHPLRWGVGPRVEVGVQPLLALMSPNVRVKVAWGASGPRRLATRHSLHYPTPLLQAVAREGVGGLLPATSTIPTILATRHELLATLPLHRHHHLTTRIGFQYAFRAGDADMATLDLPIVYHRTAAYHGEVVLRGGATVNGQVTRRLGYLLDGEMLILPASEGGYAVEQMSLLSWALARRLAVAAGYRVVYGAYPFGTDTHLLPVIDLQWTIRR